MKKTLLLFTLLISAALSSYAQNDDYAVKLGAGFSFGGAIGSNSGAYPAAGGVHIKLEYPLSDTKLSLTLSTGYTFYVSANGYSYESDGYGDSYTNGSILSFVPLQVGAKYYVADRFFLAGEAGALFNLNSSSVDENGKPIAKVSPLIVPSVGYTIPFGRTRGSVDLSVGYEANPQSGGGYNQAFFRATFNLGM
jgi:hypothetical protein